MISLWVGIILNIHRLKNTSIPYPNLKNTTYNTFTTTSLETPYFIYVVQDNTLYGYALTAGTDAENLPWIVRPSDYAAGTNEKFWKLVSMCSDHIKMANPTDSKFYPVQPVGDTIGVGDGESIT